MSYASRTALLIALPLLTITAEAAQQDAATERAAIANQRIQAEVEIRRRAAEEALEAKQKAEAEQPDQQTAAPTSPPTRLAAATPPPAEPVKSRAAMSRTLQQIRTLGELRDAGYVTDDEFKRIKTRILQGEL